MFHVSAFPERSLNRLVLVAILYLHMFLITMHEIDTAAEVYLETFQTYNKTGMILNTPLSYRLFRVGYLIVS